MLTIAAMAVGLIAAPASADLIMRIPDKEVDVASTSDELTLEAEFIGSYDVQSYTVYVTLTPRSGATGVTFNGSQAGPSPYIFPVNVGWSAVWDTGTLLAGDDAVDDTMESYADETVNLTTVTLSLDGTAEIGDEFDLEWTTTNDFSAVRDYPNDENVVTSYDNGVITVTPEPMTLGLLGLGGLALVRRRRRA
jgi:hypothetical protein